MSAAIQNEMERIRAERDALKQQLADALEREAALAAHVERQNDLLEMLVDVPELMGGKWESMSRDAIIEKPATSLTRRDLINQAEALEKLAADSFVFDADELRDRASDLRQRAQELTE